MCVLFDPSPFQPLVFSFLSCDINYLGYLNTGESQQRGAPLCNISHCLRVFLIHMQVPWELNCIRLRLAFGGMLGIILYFHEAEYLKARQSSLDKICEVVWTILP